MSKDITNYKINIDIKSSQAKLNIIEVLTSLSLTPTKDNFEAINTKIIYSTIVELEKNSPSKDEMEKMRNHPEKGLRILSAYPELSEFGNYSLTHHENYDGSGYPRGIKGEKIPVLGRIISIADSFDAMTTDRPYRKGLSLEQAIYELNKHKGHQFDPHLVEIFIDIIQQGILSTLTLENRPSF